MADVVKQHHVQQDPALNRPNYRDSRWERAVKVFTVNQESKYLLVMNVPSLGVVEELLALFRVYGEIEEYRILEEYPHEKFTDVFFFKYKQIDSARAAKRKLDNWYFFSRQLHVCYAPEFEMQEETREKLLQRRAVVAQKTNVPGHHVFRQEGVAPPPALSTIAAPTQVQQLRQQTPNLTGPPHPPVAPPPGLPSPILFARPPPPGIPSLSPTQGSIPSILPHNSPILIPAGIPAGLAGNLRFFPSPELHGRIHHITPGLPPNMIPHLRPPLPPLPRSRPPSSRPRPPTSGPSPQFKSAHSNAEVKKVTPIKAPPPLISDMPSQQCSVPPPPLVSDPPQNSPPPLISPVSNKSMILPGKGGVASVKSTTTGLSIIERVKKHLEHNPIDGNPGGATRKADSPTPAHSIILDPKTHRKTVISANSSGQGSSSRQPVMSRSSSGTLHVFSGSNSNENASSSTFSSAQKEPFKKVPIVPVQAHPHTRPVQAHSQTRPVQAHSQTSEPNRIVYCSNDNKEHLSLSISSDIQTGSSSVDSTVSNIRNKMSDIFRSGTDVQLGQPNPKKRKRI